MKHKVIIYTTYEASYLIFIDLKDEIVTFSHHTLLREHFKNTRRTVSLLQKLIGKVHQIHITEDYIDYKRAYRWLSPSSSPCLEWNCGCRPNTENYK